MKLQEIKQAISEGKPVYWSTLLYEVIKDSKDQYFIKCNANNHYIGLTWRDGVTLNGKENEFFTL
jgi:hypothetical protein